MMSGQDLEFRQAFWLSFVLVFFLGIVTHIAYDHYHVSNVPYNIVQVRENSSKYKFINPLLYIDNSSVSFPQLDPLKKELKDYIVRVIDAGTADRASAYFRDLNTGMWTGVGEDDKYVPGSILKVSTLMIYLKSAEENPGILEKEFYYDQKNDEGQHYAPEQQLPNGNYKVGILLGHAILESDNAAYYALSLPMEKELTDFYKELRMPIPPAELNDFMSPREISRLFRSLYSATYLSESYSEQALELLSRTTFDKGLVAGVDKGIRVSHKFGEHSVYYLTPEKTPDFELHDCGIVYYPEKPYLLCVMTKGKDFSRLENVLSGLSKITFSYLKEKH